MSTRVERSPRRLVLGGDMGGTSTRIVVAGYDGRPLRRGTAGGGNPIANPDGAASALDQSLRQALVDIDPAHIRAAVLGVAGGSALGRPEVAAGFARVWSGLRLGCPPTYVSDPEVAFAAGTSEPDGSVLIAGTGAVAAEIRDRRLVRTAGGHGWLLGDEGSAFWMGREAVRATLRALDTPGPTGPLAASVLAALDAPASAQVGAIIAALYRRRPIWLAELGPLVAAASEAGDPVATAIVNEGADTLAETLGRVRDPGATTPLVLAGSLTRPTSPVGARVRGLVDDRFVGRVLTAGDGAGGAAWLALAAVDPAAASADARLLLTAPGDGASA
jgi:glucosamine kinase